MWIAIVTEKGFPIHIESNLEGAIISGQLAHLFNTSKLLLEGDIESIFIGGQEAYIIIAKIDENSLLAVGIFEENKDKIEVYESKIKEILKLSKKQ